MYLTELFLKLLSMSLTASYCVLLICMARLFLRRLPKVFSYLLWSIVAVRLLCPVAVEGPFSFMGEKFLAVTDRIESANSAGNTLKLSAAPPAAPWRDSSIPGSTDASQNPAHGIEIFPGHADSGMTDTRLSDGRLTDTGLSDGRLTDTRLSDGEIIDGELSDSGLADTEFPDGELAGMDFTFSTHVALQAMASTAARIWLAGMLVLFAYCAFSCLSLQRRLKEKSSYSCHYRGIPVYKVGGLDTPFVSGYTKPAIYLPTDLTEKEACQCLAHEYTHIRRKDYLIKQFAFLLTCVYWFQPLIWLAYILMSRDMEMSCDEMTLWDADLTDRKAYSNALIRLSSDTHHISGHPLAFSENNAASRIRNILNFKRPSFRVLIPCGFLLGVLAFGLLTNPAGGSANAASSGTQLTPAPAETVQAPAETAGTLPQSPAEPAGNPSQSPAQPARNPSQSPAQPAGNPLQLPAENPYPGRILTAYQELQDVCGTGDEERISELKWEMKDLMTSYWTGLVMENRTLRNQFDQAIESGTSSAMEEAKTLYDPLLLSDRLINQAKAEMDYMDRTIDAIEGTADIVRASDYETAYPLYAVLSENNAIVRSLPKESAPEIDILSAGDMVSVISFGKYMLWEDEHFRDFLLSDSEIGQEYGNYAVVLYRSEEDGGKTTRKGYLHSDLLDISGNAAETYLYWIGKTWSEAFCSQDGNMLYRMAADRNAFMQWEYVNGIGDTASAQVEWNTSLPCARYFYHVTLLSGESPASPTAAGSDDIALQFFVQAPDSTIWTQRQDLKITASSRQLQDIRQIGDLIDRTVLFSEVRNHERITGFLAYQDAYLTDCASGPSYFDFKDNGYLAEYRPDSLLILENKTMSAYMTEQAELMAEKYLNLSGGRAESDLMTMRLRDGDHISGMVQLACVQYTFAGDDGSGNNNVTIPMFYDTDNGWRIWMPGQNQEIDSAMQKMQANMSLFAP